METPSSATQRQHDNFPIDLTTPSLAPKQEPGSSQTLIDLTLSDDEDDDDLRTTQNMTAKMDRSVVKSEPNEKGAETAQCQPKQLKSESEGSDAKCQPTAAVYQQSCSAEHPGPGKDCHSRLAQPEDTRTVDQLQLLMEFMANHSKSANHFPEDAIDDDVEDFDSGEEDADAAAVFAEQKRRYEVKKSEGKTDLTDDIEFKKLFNAEEKRKRLRQKQHRYGHAEEEVRNTSSMFFPEESSRNDNMRDEGENSNETDNCEVFDNEPNLVVHDAAGLKSGKANIEALKGPKSQSRRKGTKSKGAPRSAVNGRVTKENSAKKTSSRREARGRRPERASVRRPNMIDADHLLRQNIIEAATANVGQAPQPVFKSKDKRDALAELVASLPEDQQEQHHGDKVDLDNAAKWFTGADDLGRTAMRSDGAGGWRLRGMETSLEHYQHLGAAFLRERELSQTKPFGGMLSDDMGLGKTVTMIANIVNGRPLGRNRATLVVVPSSLTMQWLREIKQHTSRSVLRDVIVYKSGSRELSVDPVRALSNNDVVITSYHEVVKSVPENKPPHFLITNEAKEEWWEKEWKENRGALHRINWHRIVLDEAQVIKNHRSRTSEAVCRLHGKYRWAISGTPIQNGLEEFYSFFRFLRCEHTYSFELFKQNFCKKSNDDALRRLQAFLAKIMCRRTHESTLFGNPIIQLPPIAPLATIEVDFNPVERKLYDLVKARFDARIHTLGSNQNLVKNHKFIFVLLLRLRQLVSSSLFIRKTLKGFFKSGDLQKVWELVDASLSQSDENGSHATAQGLKLALETLDRENLSTKKTCKRNRKVSKKGGKASGQGSLTGTKKQKKKKYDVDENIDWLAAGGPILQSTKIKGALKKMEEWWKADESAKIIIFVQFRATISIFKRICEERGWGCAEFHGGMSTDAKDQAIQHFTEDLEIKVLIMTLRTGGVGLNIVAANRVIIIDLWWNEAVETQAWCRVFRRGQTRDVEVVRFVVKDTIDMGILQMQKRKKAEVESAMDEKQRQATLTVNELIDLFQPLVEGKRRGKEDPLFGQGEGLEEEIDLGEETDEEENDLEEETDLEQEEVEDADEMDITDD